MTDLLPTTEAVAVAWVKSLALPGIGSAVATTVPVLATWPVYEGTTRAFLQVLGTGGGVARGTPMRNPVVSVDAWAAKTSSDRPPLGAASQLLELVAAATWRVEDFPVELDLGPDMEPARVMSAYLITEHARRIPDQDTSRAHYSMDVALMWATA